jgi:carboxypeptidase C (cathepsin A)
VDKYLPTLAKGGFIDDMEKAAVAKQVAAYAGLSETAVMQNNLDISTSFFWKELLRDEGFTVGRLDSRYTGIDRRVAGDRPDFNAELTSWLHSFTPAINYYMQEVLQFKTEVKYNMFGSVRPWDRSGDQTGENLRQAMAQNPYLNVLVQSGYYDGATNYFDAKYSMWQLDPSGRMKDRLHFEGYRSGHMMYLRAEDLVTANEHLREFIKSTIPAKGKAAEYIRP